MNKLKKISILLILFLTIILGISLYPKEYHQEQNIEEISLEKEEQDKELFATYYKQAEELMKTMSLEEKVGQMFLVRYPKTGVIEEIKNENPGGYILFGRDFDNKTIEETKQELKNNQENSKIKMLFAVDEEGGTVVRVSSNKNFRPSKFLSPQELDAQGGLTAIVEDSKEKSTLLKKIGINMNLAPVVDVSTSSSNFIYKRAYGKGANETAYYTEKVIQAMNELKMISSMKHFPGYGNNVDTHTGIAIDKREYSTFETSDFLPFKAGIEVGGPTILVSHNIVECMDKEKPASLSKKVHERLRNELGFTGVILTDDLAMEAVNSYVKTGEASVQAVLAGNDMIITSDFKTQKAEVIRAVESGKISEDTIHQAVRRILALKYAYRIIE